jgi:hypothetical protein
MPCLTCRDSVAGMARGQLDDETRARVSSAGGRARAESLTAAERSEVARSGGRAGGRARADNLTAAERQHVAAAGAAAIHSALGLAKRLVKKYRDAGTTEQERADVRMVVRDLLDGKGGN